MTSIFGIISINKNTGEELPWTPEEHFFSSFAETLQHIETFPGRENKFARWIVEFTVGEKWYSICKVGDAIALRKIMESPFTL